MSRGSAASPVRVQGIARSVAGFTVMELILVLVLVSVLTGMAMPPFADWVASSRVENAARVVAGDLQQALTLGPVHTNGSRRYLYGW